MKQKGSVSLPETEHTRIRKWQDYKKHYRYGRITPLIDVREELLDWVAELGEKKSKGEETWLNDEETYRLQAICCQVYCLLLLRKKAVDSLGGFLELSPDQDDRFKVEVKTEKIEALRKEASDLVVGMVLSAIANVLYRYLQIAEGLKYAQLAEDYFQLAYDTLHQDKAGYEIPRSSDPEAWRVYEEKIDLLIFCSENRVWLCRLLWPIVRSKQSNKLNKLEDITQLLNATVNELTRVYHEDRTDDEVFAGVDLRMALALELWAVLLWTENNLDAARRRIYRALFLIRNRAGERGIKDIVRLSFCLYTAGRIEGSRSRRSYAWGIDLERQALINFRRLKGEETGKYGEMELKNPLPQHHSFYARTLVQQAHLLIKASQEFSRQSEEGKTRLAKAKKLLRKAKKEIDENLSQYDPFEGNYARWQWYLARLWIAQSKAKDYPKLWRNVRNIAAQDLPSQVDGIPRSLLLKGQFHEGLALTHLNGVKQRQEGPEKVEGWRRYCASNWSA